MQRSVDKMATPLETLASLSIEPMRSEDLDQVIAIEKTFSAPWTREMFVQELQQQWENSESLVARMGGQVLGYVLCWFVADEVHIVNLAVHSNARRNGIGRRLMLEVLEHGRARDMAIATLEVRCSNEPAIRLYTSLGFDQVALRKSYYADNGEDAIVMLKHFTAASTQENPFAS